MSNDLMHAEHLGFQGTFPAAFLDRLGPERRMLDRDIKTSAMEADPSSPLA